MIGLAKQLERWAPTSPLRCFALLTFAFVLYFACATPIASAKFGSDGVWSAAVAAAICFASASLALGVVVLFRQPDKVVVGVLLGMLFRMGLPLVAGTVLSRRGGWLADAGVFGLIVAFYLFGLVIETWLSVSLINKRMIKPVVNSSAA